MSQIIDQILYQKCTRCRVLFPNETGNAGRKICDGCRVRSFKESQKRYKKKQSSEIKHVPRCGCGSITHKMTVQAHKEGKKIYHDTGFRYCLTCSSVYNPKMIKIPEYFFGGSEDL